MGFKLKPVKKLEFKGRTLGLADMRKIQNKIKALGVQDSEHDQRFKNVKHTTIIREE